MLSWGDTCCSPKEARTYRATEIFEVGPRLNPSHGVPVQGITLQRTRVQWASTGQLRRGE